ncbi:MAG: hypothetical protein ACUVRS_08020 [Armatimonadota bacterium]
MKHLSWKVGSAQAFAPRRFPSTGGIRITAVTLPTWIVGIRGSRPAGEVRKVIAERTVRILEIRGMPIAKREYLSIGMPELVGWIPRIAVGLIKPLSC